MLFCCIAHITVYLIKWMWCSQHCMLYSPICQFSMASSSTHRLHIISKPFDYEKHWHTIYTWVIHQHCCEVMLWNRVVRVYRELQHSAAQIKCIEWKLNVFYLWEYVWLNFSEMSTIKVYCMRERWERTRAELSYYDIVFIDVNACE